MPWRREEVAPYCYEDRYIPDTHTKIYYSWVERTPEERDELYHRMNNIPYDAPEPRSEISIVEQADQARRDALDAGKTSREADKAADNVYGKARGKYIEEVFDLPKKDDKIHLMKPLQLKHKEAADKPKKPSGPKKKAGGRGPLH